MLVSVAGLRFILSEHQTTNNDIHSMREPDLFGADGRKHTPGPPKFVFGARRGEPAQVYYKF
jgi:hypothetical protein